MSESHEALRLLARSIVTSGVVYDRYGQLYVDADPPRDVTAEDVFAFAVALDAAERERGRLREALVKAGDVLYTATGLDAMRASGIIRAILQSTPAPPEVRS